MSNPVVQWMLSIAAALIVGLVLGAWRALGGRLKSIDSKLTTLCADSARTDQRLKETERRLARLEEQTS